MSIRPKAPHVQIYRWPITMALSICHRITGAMLYIGTFFLAFWLIALAYSPPIFDMLHTAYISPLGQIIGFIYCLALMLHLLGGVRHVICEAKPHLLEKSIANKIAYGTFITALALTIIIWLIGYFY